MSVLIPMTDRGHHSVEIHGTACVHRLADSANTSRPPTTYRNYSEHVDDQLLICPHMGGFDYVGRVNATEQGGRNS